MKNERNSKKDGLKKYDSLYEFPLDEIDYSNI